MEKFFKTASLAIVSCLAAGLFCSGSAIAETKTAPQQKAPAKASEVKSVSIKTGDIEFSLPEGYAKKSSSGNETTYKSKTSTGEVTVIKAGKIKDNDYKLLKHPIIKKHLNGQIGGDMQCAINQFKAEGVNAANLTCMSEDGQKSADIYKIDSSNSSYIIIVTPLGSDARLIRRTLKIH
ncbi:MAG: hypothetical protein MJ234_05670 [bacterium]|nr:hypothetical protein [bacterium]